MGNVLGSAYPELEARAPVYQPAQQQGNNLLDNYGKAVDIKNALLQGQILQNEPGIQSQQLQNMQTEQQGQQLNQALARAQYISPVLGRLVANPNTAPGDVASAAAGAVNAGIFTPEEAAKYTSDMPSAPGPQMQSWLKNHFSNSLQALSYLNGQAATLSNGRQTQLGQYSEATNSFSPAQGGTVNQMTSPEFGSSLVHVPNPDGTTTVLTQDQADQAAGGGAASPGFGANNGRYAAPGGVTSLPGGGFKAGQTTSAAAALPISGANSAQQYASMANALSTIPAQKNSLQTLLNQVTSPTGFTSGPGATQFAQTLAGLNRALGTNFDQSGIAANEVFNKTAQALANQQVGQLGAGSNEKLEATMTASPNSHISTPGLVQIVHKLQGNADFIQAWNQAGLAYSKAAGPDSYQAFASQAAKTLDPLAFQLHYMGPEEQKATLSAMSPAALSDFRQKYNQMAGMGMFQQYQAPQQQQTQPAATPVAQPAVNMQPQVPTGP